MKYAYMELGSSPCEDCNIFRHITTQEERNDFMECVSNKTCEDALNNTEIKNQYNMEEKIYTEKDLVDFGNYLLSEKRNETIESEEMKSVVGDWDIANWSENN